MGSVKEAAKAWPNDSTAKKNRVTPTRFYSAAFKGWPPYSKAVALGYRGDWPGEGKPFSRHSSIQFVHVLHSEFPTDSVEDDLGKTTERTVNGRAHAAISGMAHACKRQVWAVQLARCFP